MNNSKPTFAEIEATRLKAIGALGALDVHIDTGRGAELSNRLLSLLNELGRQTRSYMAFYCYHGDDVKESFDRGYDAGFQNAEKIYRGVE